MMKLFQEHVSEDLTRNSKIYIPVKNGHTTNTRDNNVFIVISKNDSGTHFRCTFDNNKDAEKFAEEWIEKND